MPRNEARHAALEKEQEWRSSLGQIDYLPWDRSCGKSRDVLAFPVIFQSAILRYTLLLQLQPHACEERDTCLRWMRPTIRRFNPCACVGRDDLRGTDITALPEFQSTRPRGARLGFALTHTAGLAFQSTRPRGARLGFALTHTAGLAFQSTLPRGARREMGSL